MLNALLLIQANTAECPRRAVLRMIPGTRSAGSIGNMSFAKVKRGGAARAERNLNHA
jgi:hypothetical protein